ncbi:hypothetical protein ANN_23226 [Periplaneta americana]|uniref:Uncharacterized protein n=1 Tax=Periplaneta americana TaxID=6978 RepID=A0ABQ8SLE2_PERAM|nr:hypothetical protein ANN_23226 [Periplaneta americana]
MAGLCEGGNESSGSLKVICSEQQSAAGWIDVDVPTLLIAGTQYTLYEIMGSNPIKQGALSEVVDGGGELAQKVG